MRGLPAHGAPARPTPLAGLRGQFWTEGVPPRREKVLSSSDPLIVPVEYFSAGIIAWPCTQVGLTSMAVCGVLPVVAIVPVLLAGAYLRYMGTNTVPLCPKYVRVVSATIVSAAW